MFDLFKSKKQTELQDLVDRTRNSMSNNYKDAAQDYFKKFCARYDEMINEGKLNNKQIEYYNNERKVMSDNLKEFTHKDQKPYWQ